MEKYEYVIRPMKKEDVKPISVIEEAAFSMPWKENDFLEMIEADYAYYYVAEISQGPIGVCGVRNIAGEGQITNVVVAQPYRGNGIAKHLIEYMIKESAKEGIEAFTLEVRTSNITAIRLYESLGFISEGVRPDFYEKPREDALIMWRRGDYF